MKVKYVGGFIALWVIDSLFLALGGGQVFASNQAPQALPVDRVSPELYQKLKELAPNGQLSVIVNLASQTDLRDLGASLKSLPTERRATEVESTLQAKARREQASLRTRLAQLEAQGQVSQVIPFWIFNGIGVTAPVEVIQELAGRSDVASIIPDQVIQAQPNPGGVLTTTLPASNPNLSLIDVPAVWALGFRGQGIVVANLDSGVDGTHPDLATRYRGGTNSWYDPYEQHATPTDLAGVATGHGTATMSLMVGGNASGSNIGVAPDAKWIAAKIFNDAGSATTTAIHLAFQWVLNPNHNTANPGTPQVVSSSWGSIIWGCDLSYQPDVQALLAAGILPVFSAGNFGPHPGTGTSPANLPESFSVGAINNTSLSATFSSRGPDSCGRSAPVVFPLVVAPGVNVPVAAPGGKYTTLSGTSFSAPETAGVLALLLSAFPTLSPAAQANALTTTAVDLGPVVGPDNDTGYGRIDALAAYNSLKGFTPASPTPTVTLTPTPISSPAGTPPPKKTYFPIIGH